MEVLTAFFQLAMLVLFLLALGLIMLLKPEWIWRLEHWFSVKGGEPSELYIALTRIGGMLLCFFAIGLAVWGTAKMF